MALVGARFLQQAPACMLIPEQEEGPYYIDYEKVRKNLTENKPGVPLQLRIALMDSRRCTPLENAALDIWHCDATGVYSGFTANGGGDSGPGGPGGRGGRGGPGRGGPRGASAGTDETRFLRGVQFTNKDGVAEFETLYPGWYAGRTIHIHLKVHLEGNMSGERYTGGHVSHTGQLFFPEDVTERIAKLAPYVTHSQVHRTLHSEDNVFRAQGGSQAMMTLMPKAKGSDTAGFLATIALAVDPTASPTAF